MGFAGMHAGGKGVQAADAVDKALLFQKFQRAIGDRRLVAKTFGGEAVQQLIGAKGAVCLQQDLQHPAPHRGQPLRPTLQHALGPAKRIGGTAPMVMRGKGQIRRGTAGAAVGSEGLIMRHGGPLTCYNITLYSFTRPKKRPDDVFQARWNISGKAPGALALPPPAPPVPPPAPPRRRRGPRVF